MNAETENINEVVSEAIQAIPVNTTNAEQLLLTMLRDGIRQPEVERVAGQYGIEDADLHCSLMNAGISVTQHLLYMAVDNGVRPVQALAILRSNTVVYEKLIAKRDASALQELFEQIGEIAA